MKTRNEIIIVILALLISIGIGWLSFSWLESERNTTLRLTQNSEFVVDKVRRGDRWEYYFKATGATLGYSNLRDDQQIRTLIIETDHPMGYAVGDTLRVLNYNVKQRNWKLR